VQAAAKAAGDPKFVDGIITVSYLKDPLDPQQTDDKGVKLFKDVMSKYYSDGKVDNAFNFYGMAVAWSMVDALKRSGANPTRKSLLEAIGTLNETDNPFLYAGVAARNTASDHYTITQEYQAKYSSSVGDYQPLSKLIDVRGKIKFP